MLSQVFLYIGTQSPVHQKFASCVRGFDCNVLRIGDIEMALSIFSQYDIQLIALESSQLKGDCYSLFDMCFSKQIPLIELDVCGTVSVYYHPVLNTPVKA